MYRRSCILMPDLVYCQQSILSAQKISSGRKLEDTCPSISHGTDCCPVIKNQVLSLYSTLCYSKFRLLTLSIQQPQIYLTLIISNRFCELLSRFCIVLASLSLLSGPCLMWKRLIFIYYLLVILILLFLRDFRLVPPYLIYTICSIFKAVTYLLNFYYSVFMLVLLSISQVRHKQTDMHCRNPFLRVLKALMDLRHYQIVRSTQQQGRPGQMQRKPFLKQQGKNQLR